MKKGILCHPSDMSQHGKIYVGEHLELAIERYNSLQEDRSEYVQKLPCSGRAYSRRLLKAVGNEFEASPLLHQYYGRCTLQEMEAIFSNRRYDFQTELRRIMDEVSDRFEHVAATKNLWAAYEAVKTKLVNHKAERKAERRNRNEKRANSDGAGRSASSEDVTKKNLSRARAERMRAGRERKAFRVKSQNADQKEYPVSGPDVTEGRDQEEYAKPLYKRKTISSHHRCSAAYDSGSSDAARRVELSVKGGSQRRSDSDPQDPFPSSDSPEDMPLYRDNKRRKISKNEEISGVLPNSDAQNQCINLSSKKSLRENKRFITPRSSEQRNNAVRASRKDERDECHGGSIEEIQTENLNFAAGENTDERESSSGKKEVRSKNLVSRMDKQRTSTSSELISKPKTPRRKKGKPVRK